MTRLLLLVLLTVGAFTHSTQAAETLTYTYDARGRRDAGSLSTYLQREQYAGALYWNGDIRAAEHLESDGVTQPQTGR